MVASTRNKSQPLNSAIVPVMSESMGMTRNDLTNWIVYWLKCDAAQSATVHRHLSLLSMAEIRDLEARSFRGGDAMTILSTLLAEGAPATDRELAAV